MVANFQKINEHRYQHKQYYFWQDHNGLEIDLLVKSAKEFDVFEVKSTQTLSSELFKNLKHFVEIAYPEIVNQHLVYGGEQALERSNTKVLPWYGVV